MGQLRKLYTRVEDADGASVASPTVSILRVGAEITRDASSGTAVIACANPGALRNADVCSVIRNGAIIDGSSVSLESTNWTYSAANSDWEMEISGTGYDTITVGDRLVLTGANSSHFVSVYSDDVKNSSAVTASFSAASTGVIEKYVDAIAVDIKVVSGSTTTYFTDIGTDGGNYVIPEEFGAVGDGSTDDSGALNEAILHASTLTNGTVFLGPKTYAIGSVVSLYSGVSIVGSGRESSIVYHTGTGVAFQNGESSTLGRAKFSNFQVKANSNTTIVFDMERSFGCYYESLYILGNGSTGIAFKLGDGLSYSAYYNTFMQVEVNSSFATAWLLGEAANDTTLLTCRTTSIDAPVDCDQNAVAQCRFIACSFENFDTGTAVALGGNGGHTVQACRFENSVGGGARGTGISIAASTENCRIIGNSYSTVTTTLSDSGTDTWRFGDDDRTLVGYFAMQSGYGMVSALAMRGYTIYLTGDVGDASGSNALILSGSGSPEGSNTAGPGSLYVDTDGGANTTLYVKESGSGNTGWVAK